MSTQRYTVLLPNRFGDFVACATWLTDEQRDTIEAAGYTVDLVLNTVPDWVMQLGMGRAWCFAQDLFSFRWRNLFLPRS